jgi:hypothetical protein
MLNSSESDYIHNLFHLQQTTVFPMLVNQQRGVVSFKVAALSRSVVITRVLIGQPSHSPDCYLPLQGPRLRSLAGTTRERKGIKKGFGSLSILQIQLNHLLHSSTSCSLPSYI